MSESIRERILASPDERPPQPARDPVDVALGLLMAARASIDAALELLSTMRTSPPSSVPPLAPGEECSHPLDAVQSVGGFGAESYLFCTRCGEPIPGGP